MMKKFFALLVCCALAFVAGSALTSTLNTQTARPEAEVMNLSKIERTVYTADELAEMVRDTAKDAGFDPDKAERFLEERWQASEVRDAMKDGDPQKLDWVFAEAISDPKVTDDGESYQMTVRPIKAISNTGELPAEFEIHGYTKYCAEDVSAEDLILFPADQLDDMDTRFVDGEIVWRTYAYTVTK